MNEIWLLAVTELALAATALALLAASALTPRTNAVRHAGLRGVATVVGTVSGVCFLGILLLHRLLVGIEDFLFGVAPAVVSLASCAFVVWRGRATAGRGTPDRAA